jgi:hypothetical protein
MWQTTLNINAPLTFQTAAGLLTVPISRLTSRYFHWVGAFDVILGMDWLEAHNPHIDWIAKSLQLDTPKGQVCLQGHKHNQLKCSAISASELSTVDTSPTYL